MLCDHCKERDAVVHLTQIVDNAVTQLHFCEKCAAAKGVETTVAVPKHPLAGLLQTAQQQLAGGLAAGQLDAMRCAFCSATLRDFKSSGRLGCAHCYGAFEGSLRDLLRRVHGNSRHVGQRYQPPRPDMLQRESTLEELRTRLRRAIEAEQFEVAADLRDRIRVLE